MTEFMVIPLALSTSFGGLPTLPADARPNCQKGNREGREPKGKGPAVGSCEVEKGSSQPRPQSHPEPEADFEKAEDGAYMAAPKNIGDDHAVNGIPCAVADPI